MRCKIGTFDEKQMGKRGESDLRAVATAEGLSVRGGQGTGSGQVTTGLRGVCLE
jgi:hypothetical protein